MKLDFVVVGFGKCGTTSLGSALADHPDIFVPKGNETAFFAFNHRKGWRWYGKHFEDAHALQILGEKSGFYATEMWETESCERILKYFPDIRLIFIARDPIARLESYYRELHHSGHLVRLKAPYTIGDTLRAFPHLIRDTLYWKRINTWRRCFPDSRIHVLFLEDLSAQPEVELARCFEFLGVAPSVAAAIPNRRLNAGTTKFYDSKLMRTIHASRALYKLWRGIPTGWRDRFARRTRMRIPFRGPVQWDASVRDWVLQETAEDTRQFLEFYGKPPGFWSRQTVESCGGSEKLAAA